MIEYDFRRTERTADKGISATSFIARDITSLKRILREQEEVLALESAARAEAERVGRMKDEFLTALSHELQIGRAHV